MSPEWQAHTDTKKKDVIRATFAAMIELSELQHFKTRQLQDFATTNRGPKQTATVTGLLALTPTSSTL